MSGQPVSATIIDIVKYKKKKKFSYGILGTMLYIWVMYVCKRVFKSQKLWKCSVGLRQTTLQLKGMAQDSVLAVIHANYTDK